MVRAGRSKRGEPFHILGVDEFQNRITVGEVPDHMLLARYEPANGGHQSCGSGAAILCGHGFMNDTAECVLACRFLGKPIHRSLDDVDGQLVAVLRVVCPGEQTVAFQNDALGIGVLRAEV